jgi:hypothetical protein
MKKIILPIFIGVISFATITSCKKEAKTPVATNVSSATTKTPTTNTNTQSQPASQNQPSGGCHNGSGHSSGSH